jgi:hypothetical protein
MARSSSLAACVKIMNMLFHPLLTLSTWPLTCEQNTTSI